MTPTDHGPLDLRVRPVAVDAPAFALLWAADPSRVFAGHFALKLPDGDYRAGDVVIVQEEAGEPPAWTGRGVVGRVVLVVRAPGGGAAGEATVLIEKTHNAEGRKTGGIVGGPTT